MKKANIIPHKTSITSQIITPGTRFMFQLSQAIQVLLKQKMLNDPTWGKLHIIFSDSNVPGEGEHKMIDYMKELKRKGWLNLSHTFYSNDSDLILMLMTTELQMVNLFKEEFYFPDRVDVGVRDVPYETGFEFISIDLVNNLLEFDLMKCYPSSANPLWNFLFLLGFQGNDFVPYIRMFELKTQNFDVVL